MGNRAVITYSIEPEAPAIYLHWNGGRASVEAFLAAARKRRLTSMDSIAKMIADWMEVKIGMTVYRMPYGEADSDNYDNGTYVINKKMEIVERLFTRGCEEIDPEKTAQILEELTR